MSESQQVVMRDVEALQDNPLNPRGALDAQDPAILELAESVKAHGLLQPLLITPEGFILAGHRRRLACRIAGLQQVPCLERSLTEQEQIEVMLIENLQRKDLSAYQAALGFQALHERGLAIADIAQRVGMHTMTVRKHLGILKLPAEVHDLFARGVASLGYVFPLLEVADPAKQVELLKRATAEGWLVNQMMSEVHALNRPRAVPAAADEPRDRRQAILNRAIDKLAEIRNSLDCFEDLGQVVRHIGTVEDRLTDYAMLYAKKQRSKVA